MFHDRTSAWNKMIAKFRWHFIYPFAVKWDMTGNLQMTTPLIINGLVAAFSSNNLSYHNKHADDNTIDYQWTSGCIFLQQLINIMCASDTGLESESQNDDDTEQSTEVDNMIDVVCEDETDDEANF